MSSNGDALKEWLEQFNAAIVRWARARRNEERWLPALNEQVAQAIQLKRDFYAAFGLTPEEATELNDLIHGTRHQKLIERIRQARIDAQAGIRWVCDRLQALIIRFSPHGQEEATLKLVEQLSRHPFTNCQEILAVVEKLIALQPPATAPISTPAEPRSGPPAPDEETPGPFKAAAGPPSLSPGGDPNQSAGPPSDTFGDGTPPGRGRRREPDLKMSRKRIELVNQLRGELTQILLRNKAAFTGPTEIRQLYPDFALWKLVSPQEFWSDLCSEERFRFKRYADILVCRKYQLTDVDSLKKDRQKLRRGALRSNVGRS